jgi:hypothetical protein
MKNRLIVNGRFSWPLLVAFLYLVATIIVFDLLWRVLTVSFEALALGAVVVAALGAGLIFVLARGPKR